MIKQGTIVRPGLEILGVTKPEGPGEVVVVGCPECRKIEIAFSLHAPKVTEDGNAWIIPLHCFDHPSLFRFETREDWNFAFDYMVRESIIFKIADCYKIGL